MRKFWENPKKKLIPTVLEESKETQNDLPVDLPDWSKSKFLHSKFIEENKFFMKVSFFQLFIPSDQLTGWTLNRWDEATSMVFISERES